ncbi:unnamed protein product [Arctogadus glacialis]
MAFSLRTRNPTDTPRTSGHMIMHAVTIALATLTHILCEVVRCLATDPSTPNALFQVSARNVSATFPMEVSMDTWAENCWIMINIWTLAWMLHAMATLFQRSVVGPLSCNPEIHSPLFFLVWTTINMFRMAAILHWSRYDLVGTLISRWLVVGCSFFTLGMSYRNLAHHSAWLQINHPAQICWIRYLAQNGLAVFCSWSLLEALVVLGQVLCYVGGFPDPMISSIIFLLILLFIKVWIALERLVFPRHLCYTFTTYPTLILGLGAMFTASYKFQAMAANTILCGIIMVLATCFSIASTVYSCFLDDEPPAHSPALEFDLTSEGCETVCKVENDKTKHIKSVPHILKKILSDVRVGSH